MKKTVFLFALLLSSVAVSAQYYATLYGTIKDSLDHPIDLANLAIIDSRVGTMTNADGTYEIEVPTEKEFELVVSCVGYISTTIKLELESGELKELDIILKQDITSFREISVSARQERASTFQNINIKDLEYMPSTTGKIEAMIVSQAGVSSTNELSSQYSVRGGNFDENLVYVNDIEIYRPFLVRSGQQEGLSFINSDLVSSIRFSAGGFDARYGDKMSSALDITYKTPDEFAGSVSVSLLGASVHLEGASKTKRFTYLAGYRYKTTSYLLNSLETSGDYKPQFSDFQTLVAYKFSSKVKLSFLGNYSANNYKFIPDTRETEFGTQALPFNFTIYYDGQEVDKFDTYLGALSLDIEPNNNLDLKFIATAFQTSEQETFDISGEYWINQLDNTVGSESYGDSVLNIGVGALHNHARNYLDAYVLAASHVGTLSTGNHLVKWGMKFQYQAFFDQISEWEMIDSAGFSLPYNGSEVSVIEYSRAENHIEYTQLNSFIQDTWEFNTEKADIFFTLGVRGSLWNFNKTFMLSPRMTFSVQPKWNHDMMFHASAGVYYQPPFFKELKNSSNEINYDIKPQKSTHLLIGGDYIFSAWGDRPFKITAELYYKWLENLIPYKIENVRIKYAGVNNASGYATGLDLKINGEFVPGAESWFTASIMRTREDIDGDSALFWVDEEQVWQEAGFYSRPTEQLFSAGAYFQDYLPNNPDYKVMLSAFFATGLPLSHPEDNQYYTTYRMSPYRRVDLGFAKLLKRENQQLKENNPLRHFTSIWLSAEVFNLLGINNEASYSWIRTVSNQEGIPGMFGVPNYLTGRRFNVKVTARF